MIHEKELHQASSLYDTGITKLLKEIIYLSSVGWSLVADLRIEILYKKNYFIFLKRVADIRRLSMKIGSFTFL
jgi:hypothetical protein